LAKYKTIIARGFVVDVLCKLAKTWNQHRLQIGGHPPDDCSTINKLAWQQHYRQTHTGSERVADRSSSARRNLKWQACVM
jgi:hypothetical protein